MAERSRPLCDLVMKGGISSGIVYPPAVLELKDAYTFHSIGGTSAGAIGAAATAAAEYNRPGGGFEKLDAFSKHLGQNSNLLELFQATSETQPALDVLLEILRIWPIREDSQAQKSTSTTASARLPLFLQVIQWFFPQFSLNVLKLISNVVTKWQRSLSSFRSAGRIGSILGIVIGLILALLFSLATLGALALFFHSPQQSHLATLSSTFLVFGVVLGVLGGWLGLWLARTVHVVQLLWKLASGGLGESFYGICPGHTPVPDAQNANTSLTDWLGAAFDEIAGFSSPDNPQGRVVPLTFKDLKERDVELKMVASNLSHSLPYVVPDDLTNFIFNESEMRDLFPDYVIEQLKTPPTHPLLPPELLPAGYYFLPDADNLPVIFATRLSLSFPFLLSAVPLYTISTTAYQAYQQRQLNGPLDADQHLQRNWFSDGGICSNFPIQFFDAWLPRHPTFGINLTKTRQAASVLHDSDNNPDAVYQVTQTQGDDVYLPGAQDDPHPEWREIKQLPSFLMAIFGTAQTYRDTLQSHLPSYRERIMQIRLAPSEGGLHLTMSPEIIERVVQKGKEAGEGLRHFNFEQHQWVRFLVLMARLEENLENLQGRFDAHALFNFASGDDFESFLEREWRSANGPESIYPYYRNREWCQEALRRVKSLQSLVDTWQLANRKLGHEHFFQDNAPQPETVLRVTPEI